VQSFTGVTRFVHPEVQAEIAAAGIHKSEENKRLQITSVSRTHDRQAEPPAGETRDSLKAGAVAGLDGDAREEHGQFHPREPRRGAQNKMADRQP